MNRKIAIIIPHFNGLEILTECLDSLEVSIRDLANVYIVDNGSTDDSIQFTINNYPWVNIFKLENNLGYSGGCNYGVNHTNEEYVLFLNNDTIHEKNWLKYLFETIEENESIGAIQPKIRSYYNHELFDYSGACGGELDFLGYPFMRGRIFDTIEKDTMQYDSSKYIFWASGTAILIRRSAINIVGSLDDDFFAHMEEIDLCWRLQKFGWKIAVEPKSVIYHHSGYTLDKMNKLKMFLNHRNNLFMLYKNLDNDEFARVFIKRFILEFITLFYALLKFDFNRVQAVISANIAFFKSYKKFKTKRQFILDNHTEKNVKLYRKSIVVDYFLKKKKLYSSLGLN